MEILVSVPIREIRGSRFPGNFGLGYGWNRLEVRIRATRPMLWTLFVLLLLAWMVCVLVANVAGIAIHLLLVLAAIVLLVRLVGTGRG